MVLLPITSLVVFASIFLFTRLRVSAHTNPVLWYWFFYLGISLLALSFTSNASISGGIYFSMIACFAVYAIFQPPLKIYFGSGTERASSLNMSSLLLLTIIFFVPFVINVFNQSDVGITSFGDRNSSIVSMPLAVVSRTASSLMLPFLFLTKGRLRKVLLFLIFVQFILSLFTFSYSSSKSILLSIPFILLTVFFSDDIFLSCDSDNQGLRSYSLSRMKASLLSSIFLKLSNPFVSLKLLFVALSFAGVSIATIVLLGAFNFPFEAVVFRISYNYDTLIYLSRAFQDGSNVGYPGSGFFTIFSVYLKPFLSLFGGSDLYPYRSVPQYVMSIFQGSYYEYSSLGNSNLIAESIASSNYLIGIVLAPFFYYLFLHFVRICFSLSNGDYFLNLLSLFAYFQCYSFFSSGQEVVMSMAIPGSFFIIRLLYLSFK